MKHLFSPWRSAYIETFKGGKKSRGCLLCAIAKTNHDRKNLVAWRGKHCYVVLNRFPYNSGHLMIVPYRHTADIARLSMEEQAECFLALKRCVKALHALSAPQGFNFGANFGRLAGAGIASHIHYHLVPRWNGDTNFMPVLADTKLISEDLRKLRDTLAKSLRTPKKTRTR